MGRAQSLQAHRSRTRKDGSAPQPVRHAHCLVRAAAQRRYVVGRTTRLLLFAAPFLAVGVLVSGFVEGRLVLPAAIVLAVVGFAAGLAGGWQTAGLAAAGPLLVGAGFFGTFGAGMVGGVLFSDSAYVSDAGPSDYRSVYGVTYLALALTLAAGAFAVLRVSHPSAGHEPLVPRAGRPTGRSR